MANRNTPTGLRPVKYHDGTDWNGSANWYYVPATDTNAYFMGDVVAGTAGGDSLTGLPAVILAGTRGANMTSGATRGVVTGFATAISTPGGNMVGGFDPNNLSVVSVPATKAYGYYLLVVDDPAVIYEAQMDTTVLTAAIYGKNAALSIGAAPTGPVNQSLTVIAGATAATTATLPVKLMGAPNRPDNDLSAAYADVFVTLNTSDYGAGATGTAGY